MAKINDVHSVTVQAKDVDFTLHTYTEIYGGKTGCKLGINGVSSLAIGPSSSVYIIVRSITGGTGCFLSGSYNDVYNGSTDLSNTGIVIPPFIDTYNIIYEVDNFIVQNDGSKIIWK